MAEFGIISLTNAGINALVKAQAGNSLVFTKIKMGSGTFSGDVLSLTDLTEVKLSAEIIKGTMLNNTYTVEAHFTNEGLSAGFYWREIGLYVKDSSGNDVLFGYANSGATADYIPATASDIYTKHVRISVAVGDVQNITVEHSSGTYVDVITFEESMDTKVDKEDGKGLSTNDYSNEEKLKVANTADELKTLSDKVSENIKQLEQKFDSYVTTQGLENSVKEINDAIENTKSSLEKLIEELETKLNSTNQKIGTTNISSIGDGTVTGAIAEIHRMLSSMPTITSGTSEPSGGKDGDVYVMYEE